MSRGPRLTMTEISKTLTLLETKTVPVVAEIMGRTSQTIYNIRARFGSGLRKKEPMKLILCNRCGIVKFAVPLDRDKQPTCLICGVCRGEVSC